MASWRRAPKSNGLPPELATQAPTAKLNKAVSTTEAATAAAPEVRNQGSSGVRAPRLNRANEEPAATRGEPNSSGLSPKTVREVKAKKLSASRGSSVLARWPMAHPKGTPCAWLRRAHAGVSRLTA